MARNYYKDGAGLAFIRRKKKFGRYNPIRDLNGIIYAYQLKNNSGIQHETGGTIEDLGNTLNAFLTRVRSTGDQQFIFNLTKSKNLTPAGRLNVIEGIDTETPIFTTDDEGAAFSNAETLNFTTNIDVINTGGKDQMIFFSPNELEKPENISGDLRNVGRQIVGPTNSYDSFNVNLLSGNILTWNITDKKFYVLNDTSIDISSGEITRNELDDQIEINELHDLRQIQSNNNRINLYLALVDDLKVIYFSFDVDDNFEFLAETNISSGKGSTRPQLAITQNDYEVVHSNGEITLLNLDRSLEPNVIRKYAINDEGVMRIGATGNKLFGLKRINEKDLSIQGFEYREKNTLLANRNKEQNSQTYLSTKNFTAGMSNNYVIVGGGFLFNTELQKLDVEGNIVSRFNLGKNLSNVISQVHFSKDGYIMLSFSRNKFSVFESKAFVEYFLLKDNGDSFEKIWEEYNDSISISGYNSFGEQVGYVLTNIEKNEFVIRDFESGGLRKINKEGNVEKKWNTEIITGIGNLVITGENIDINIGNFNLSIFNFETGNLQKLQTIDLDNAFFNPLASTSVISFNKISYKDENINSFTIRIIEEKLSGFKARVLLHTKDQDSNFKKVWKGSAGSNTSNSNSNNTRYAGTPIDFINEKKIVLFERDNKIKFFDIQEDGEIVLGREVLTTSREAIDNINVLNFADSLIRRNLIRTSNKTDDENYFLYVFDESNQFFKTWEIDTTNVVPIKIANDIPLPENIQHEFYANGVAHTLDDAVIFYGNGIVVRITKEELIRANVLQLKRYEADTLIDVVDIEETSNNGYIGIGMPYSKNKLKKYEPEEVESYPQWPQNNIFALSQTLEYIIPPKQNDLVIDQINYSFTTSNTYINEEDPSKGLKQDGIWNRISQFGNGQIYVSGLAYDWVDPEASRGGIFFEKWSNKNVIEKLDALGEENRSEPEILEPIIKGQQIYLSTSKRKTPTTGGEVNHYDYSVGRIDIPRFKTDEGKYVTPTFFLDATLQGVNTKYLDIKMEAWGGWNSIELFDENDDIIPYEIADTNFETGENLRDEEILKPNIFNNALGNDAWNITKMQPLVNGSIIYYDFWDVSQLRFYEQFKYATLSLGTVLDIAWDLNPLTIIGDIIFDLPMAIRRTMIKGASYTHYKTKGFRERFSQDFLKRLFGWIPGSNPQKSHNVISTSESSYGLGVASLRFIEFDSGTLTPPKRIWETSNAPYIMDFFMTKIITDLLPESIYISQPILNPRLFNEDGSHTKLYKDLKNQAIKGIVTIDSTTFDKVFSNDNGGTLATIEKNKNPQLWNANNSNDKKYLMLIPNTIEELKKAIHESEVGENPETNEEIVITSGFPPFNLFPKKAQVPIATNMYSRLDQQVMTNNQYVTKLGLRTNSKLRLKLAYPAKINRLILNNPGGKAWTFTQWDDSFNLAKDAEGVEVIPITLQSPNVSLTPADATKNIFLDI